MKFDFNFKRDKLKDVFLLLGNLYLPLFGLIWICFHLYIRFILERTAYSLSDLKDTVSFKFVAIFIIFIVIHISVILISLIILIKRNTGYKHNTIFYKISHYASTILNQTYWKPLEFVHDKIAPHIPGSGRFFVYLETKWQTKKFTYIVIGLFDIFPKIFVATIFFIETIFFQRINIFIYSLTLFIIPLLFSIFLKLFFSFAERNAPELKEYFDSIKGIGEPIKDERGQIVDYMQYEYIVKPEYVDIINVQEEVALLKQLRRIIDIVIFTKETLHIISPYVLMLTSSIYLIGGLYRLLYLLW